MDNDETVESQQASSYFTLLTWLAPLAIGVLSAFVAPIIADGYGEFGFFVLVGSFLLGLAIGAFVGCVPGIMAFLRKEPKRSAAWVPMVPYVAIMILVLAIFFT